ncbi:hypothetical protein [Streptomyces sp. NPDC050738]|uniref:hypothetical protein n=1 Tax=Streptomyces sp. NPDC050738 TaxID=3154744 RepID=UPI00342C1DB9
MEVLGDIFLRFDPHRSVSERPVGAALAMGVIMLGLAACSGQSGPEQVHAASPTPKATPSSPGKSLDDTAKPAVALVNEHTPSSYRASADASGYDWSKASGQKISESLPGDHLFQIACSGSGGISMHIYLPEGDKKEHVECGAKAKSISFNDNFDVIIDGDQLNDGAYAWRMLRRV